MSAKAIFLDRDGTIIFDRNYLKEPAGVELIPGVCEALCLLQDAGYLLFVVSNQSGVSRGLISDLQFIQVHQRFDTMLRQAGVRITEYAYCLHHPDARCPCRKPGTLLVDALVKKHLVDTRQSFVVGDKDCDVELGLRTHAHPVLVMTGNGRGTTVDRPSSSYSVIESASCLADQVGRVTGS